MKINGQVYRNWRFDRCAFGAAELPATHMAGHTLGASVSV